MSKLNEKQFQLKNKLWFLKSKIYDYGNNSFMLGRLLELHNRDELYKLQDENTKLLEDICKAIKELEDEII